MSAHTPGPWQIYRAKDGVSLGIDGPLTPLGDKTIVAYSVESEADARLIAAAPELLAAAQAGLTTIVQLACMMATGKEPTDQQAQILIQRASADSPGGKLRDAIAKATGEAP